MLRYLYVSLAAFALGGLIAYKWQQGPIKELEGQLNVIKQAGVSAKKQTEVITVKQVEVKNVANTEYERTIAALRADNKRLRQSRSDTSGSYLPTPSPSTKRTDLACFDRNEFERALRDFDAGIQKLIDEGDEGTVALDIAKRWVHGIELTKP